MRKAIALVLLCGCPSQVGIIANENPHTASGAKISGTAPKPSSIDLEEDEQVIEPDHPAVKTPQERALTHLHTPSDVCSGVVIGPRLVATAHQCFPNDVAGVYKVEDKDKDRYRVEVASSTLTWTARAITHVITPTCEWKKLDLAIAVLDEDAPPLAQPASVTSAPGPGGAVQALGFGKCRGDDRAFSSRTGPVTARRDQNVIIDVLLCQGDVGGGVFDTSAGGYVGVISSHGEGPEEALRTAVIRFDTPRARDLVNVARAVAKGDTAAAVTCN